MMGRPFVVMAVSLAAFTIALPSMDAVARSTPSDSFVAKAAGNLDRLIKEETSEGLMPKTPKTKGNVHPPKKAPGAFQDDPLSLSTVSQAGTYEENKESTKQMMEGFKNAKEHLEHELSTALPNAEQELAAIPTDEPMPPSSVLVDDTEEDTSPDYSTSSTYHPSQPIAEGLAQSDTDAVVAEIADSAPSSPGQAVTDAEAAGQEQVHEEEAAQAKQAADEAAAKEAKEQAEEAHQEAAQNVQQNQQVVTTPAPTPATGAAGMTHPVTTVSLLAGVLVAVMGARM